MRDPGSPWKPRTPRNPPPMDEAAASHPARERRDAELRIYGINAVRALFAKRPQALRKLYLLEARIPQLQPLLKWCVANRVGYRVVEEGDLQKLAASAHHEGVVAEVLREEPMPLSTWLRDLPPGPCCALWLDGVGNPHNLGAILRSAAHFGVGMMVVGIPLYGLFLRRALHLLDPSSVTWASGERLMCVICGATPCAQVRPLSSRQTPNACLRTVPGAVEHQPLDGVNHFT